MNQIKYSILACMLLSLAPIVLHAESQIDKLLKENTACKKDTRLLKREVEKQKIQLKENEQLEVKLLEAMALSTRIHGLNENLMKSCSDPESYKSLLLEHQSALGKSIKDQQGNSTEENFFVELQQHIQNNNWNILHLLAHMRNDSVLKQVINATPPHVLLALLDSEDIDGRTPVQVAADLNNTDVLIALDRAKTMSEELIAEGNGLCPPSVDDSSWFGWTSVVVGGGSSIVIAACKWLWPRLAPGGLKQGKKKSSKKPSSTANSHNADSQGGNEHGNAPQLPLYIEGSNLIGGGIGMNHEVNTDLEDLLNNEIEQPTQTYMFLVPEFSNPNPNAYSFVLECVRQFIHQLLSKTGSLTQSDLNQLKQLQDMQTQLNIRAALAKNEESDSSDSDAETESDSEYDSDSEHESDFEDEDESDNIQHLLGDETSISLDSIKNWLSKVYQNTRLKFKKKILLI